MYKPYQYVGACNQPFRLVGTDPHNSFRVMESDYNRCQLSPGLREATILAEAHRVCANCEHAEIEGFLQPSAGFTQTPDAQPQPSTSDVMTCVKGAAETWTRETLYAEGYKMRREAFLVEVYGVGYRVFFWQRDTDQAWLLEYVSWLHDPLPRMIICTAEQQQIVHTALGLPAPEKVKDSVDCTWTPEAEKPVPPPQPITPSNAAAQALAGHTAPEPEPAAEPEPEPTAELEPEPAPELPARAVGLAELLHDGSEKPPLHDLMQLAGPSLNGPSKQRTARTCLRRFFYSYVMGYDKPREVELTYSGHEDPHLDALGLGSMVHTMLEKKYKGQNPYDEEFRAVEEVYPDFAAEASRLFDNHTAFYTDDEVLMWDVRFIEMESRMALPKRRIKTAKRQVSLTLSCRTDLGYRPLKSGQARLEPGVPCDDIILLDHKTTAQMTMKHREGFGLNHEIQTLQNLLVFNNGYEVKPDGTWHTKPNSERYGTATRFVYNWIGKAKRHDPDKHLSRPMITPNPQVLASYLDDTTNFMYEEIGERLFHEKALEKETWPKSYVCRDVVTGFACPFITACSMGDYYNLEQHFIRQKDETLLIRAETIEAPKITKRRKRTKTAAEVEGK
jgi:hypothetical protein